MSERELKCCVSGSYSKYKPEIDNTISELQALGIKVLEPSAGWILLPFGPRDFRPLPGEIGLDQGEVEDRYLAKVAISDFLYVDNHDGYYGDMVAVEIGFAIGKGVPVFLREKPSEFLENHPELMDYIVIAKPEEVKTLLQSRK